MNPVLCNKGRAFIFLKLTLFQGLQMPLTRVRSKFQNSPPSFLAPRVLRIITPSHKIDILFNIYTFKKNPQLLFVSNLERMTLRQLTFAQNFPKN